MRNKTFGLALAICFVATAACFAEAGSNVGTWKLNPAKSQLSKYMGHNDTVDYEWSFMKTKVTISGVDANGHALHSEWRGKFDGHDYPVTGDPISDMRSYAKVNEHTLNFTASKGGKEVYRGVIVVALDEKSRTVTTWGMHGKKRIKSVAVYDKVK